MRGYDKWSAYIPNYERILDRTREGSSYLEIGVQNMGWVEALDPTCKFVEAVGVDIDSNVAEHKGGTRYTHIIVGDASEPSTLAQVQKLGRTFDLIVDDGSHTQRDVISCFIQYWSLLAEGGTYVVEDTHTDFSPPFALGNYFGVSIYDFFQSLAALSTLGSIAPDALQSNLAYRTMNRFFPSSLCDRLAQEVAEVSFTNSMVMIVKGEGSIGTRVLEGDEWPIVGIEELRGFGLEVLRNTMDVPVPDLAVVYLNRLKNEDEKLARQRFVDAFKRYKPSTPYSLYVINKGFDDGELHEQYRFFQELTPNFINLGDDGIDLSAYRQAALKIPESVVFFMNTYSEPLQTNWLEGIFETFMSSAEISLVGCSASTETAHPFLPEFPEYPNFHVRTNGFMLKREDFLALTEGRTLLTKEDGYQVEAGTQSLTRMVLASGKKVVPVGLKGAIKPRSLWRKSLFRCGRQRLLLLADNQTRAYEQSSTFGKIRLWALTHTRLSQLVSQRIRWYASNDLKRRALGRWTKSIFDG